MSIIDKLKAYVTGASIAGAAYTPKTEYKGSLPKGTVRNKSKGSDVTAVQTFLNWAVGAGLTVDAICGPKTVAAIKAFQKKNGITADGIFGPNTKAKAQALINKHKKKPTPPKKTYKVIDVSEFQDAINWTKVKAAGIQGVIVRCGYRGATAGTLKTDGMFLNHIKGAYKAGLHVGIYMFTEAVNAAEGKAEADYAIKLWQTAGVPLSFPIAVDTEAVNIKGARANNLSVAKRTEAIKGFCDRVKARGYEPMIYASTSWLNNQLDMSKLPYNVWVAQYNSTCEYKGKYVMWQYSSSGKVNGVKGNVDMNNCYIEPKKVNPPKATPSVDPLQKWYDAMKTQFNWSKNQKYEWVVPTIESSKTKGTCITFPSVSLQRLGMLPSGGYLYYYPDSGKIFVKPKNWLTNHKDWFEVSYPKKTIKALGNSIKKGDIVGFGNPAYHTMVYMGKNANGDPIFNTMGHKKGLGVTYATYATRKVDMIVRIKKIK